MAFSPDGRLLATGGVDKLVRLWDVASGRETRRFEGHTQKVNAVAFSPDGTLLASASDDNSVVLWDVATGRKVRSLLAHSIFATCVAFSPDGETLASGSADNTVVLWDVAHGVARTTLRGHSDTVRSVAFSADGADLISGGEDRTVRLWSVADGSPSRILEGHGAWVVAVAAGPAAHWVASASVDGSIRIWDSATGAWLAALIGVRGGEWLVVTPDGLFDGSPVAWSVIQWRFSRQLFDVAPVEVFFNEFFQPGLLADVLAGRRPAAPAKVETKDRRQPRLAVSIGGNGTSSTRAVTVRISVLDAPAGARDLRLFRNGRLVHVWSGDVSRSGAGGIEAEVPIEAGRNDFVAYCFNRDNIKSRDALATVVGDEGLRRRGSVYVLAIGVDRYLDSQYDLRYAVADAEMFASELQRLQAATGQFERVQVVTLFDAAATRANILAALTRLSGSSDSAAAVAPAGLATLQRAQPEDTVFIYFAGHGTAASARYYMVPHDFGVGVADSVTGDARVQAFLRTCISDVDLEGALEGIDAGQLVFVLDSCNSGEALEAADARKGPMNSKGLAQLAYDKGLYFLAAAQGFQEAVEARRLGHGYFTYALVEEGLRESAADNRPSDGKISLDEWFEYATARVPELLLADRDGGTRKVVLGAAAATTTRSPDLQRPRAFVRSRTEAERFVVAGVSTPGVGARRP